MKTLLVSILASLMCALPAYSATYWVSQAGGLTGSGNCSAVSGSSDPGSYMTVSAMAAADCPTAGDTVMFKANTYTGAGVRWDTLIPNGTSASNKSKILCETHRGCTIATAKNSSNGVIEAWNVQNFQIGDSTHGFVVDGVNAGASCMGIKFEITSSATNTILTGVVVQGNYVKRHTWHGINFTERVEQGTYYSQVDVNGNYFETQRLPIVTSEPIHAIYVAIRNSTIQHNYAETPANSNSYGIHSYHTCVSNSFHDNYVVVNSPARGFICADSDSGLTSNSTVYRNVFKMSGTATRCFTAFNSSDSVAFYNNTCDGFAEFISNQAGATGNSFVNNLCVGTCSIIQTTALSCSGTCSTTNPIVVAATHFKDAANGNYSLKAGSSQIDAGVNVGLPFSGSAPDRGAFESFTPTGAVIAANQLDVTLDTAFAPPQPTSGATGWSVSCSGTGCGTPVVSNVSLLSGSSTILRLTITGITGNACAVGQTWTWSFNSATGAVVDSINMGNSTNQPMFTYSTQTTTNSCSGAPPDPPANIEIYYKLDDGTSGTTPTTAIDSAGSAENGTLTGGATWTTGKYGSGVQLANSSGQYIAVPYGSGVNPSTQSLTIAFGVFVTSGTENGNYGYFGAPLGTNQRLYISTNGGSWRLGIQSSGDTTASNLGVQSGWNRLCLVIDSGTDTATLYRNGTVATPGGAVKTYTSYTLSGDFQLGRIANIATGGGGIFDEFRLWTSVVSCADDYLAWEPPPPDPTGVYSQTGHQFVKVHKTAGGGVENYGAANTTVPAVQGGAIGLTNTVGCTIADCDSIGVTLWYTFNGGTAQALSDGLTSDQVSFYGSTSDPSIIAGSVTSAAAVFDVGQNQSFTHTSLIQFGPTAAGTYCFMERNQNGNALNGTYSPAAGACVVVGPTQLQRGF